MKSLLLTAALVAVSGLARADELCFGASVPLQTTSYSSSVTVPKFNPALGTLTGVRIQLASTILGDPAVENQDAQAAQTILTFCADVRVRRPDNTIVALVVPVAQFFDSLAAFDGTVDFAGTSGVTHAGATASSQTLMTLSAPGDLALFAGPLNGFATITLPVDAQNTAFAQAPAGSTIALPQQASIAVSVCYVYTPVLQRFCAGDGTGTACPCGNASGLGAFAGCTNSSGVGARLAASGYPSVASDAVTLTCSDVPAGAPVLFFQGTARANGGSGTVFGDGLMCVGGTITRIGTRFATFGVASYPQAGDATLSVVGALTGGDVRTYQVWHRDAQTFCSPAFYNLTNGVEVAWQ